MMELQDTELSIRLPSRPAWPNASLGRQNCSDLVASMCVLASDSSL